MKKILCLCFILCLSLSGCQASRVPGLDWDAEKMVELQVFTGGVPAAAQRKITRDTEDIRQVAQALFSLEAARDAVNEDVPCGGIGTYFCLPPGGWLPRGGAPGQRQGFAHHRGGLLQASAPIPLRPGRPVELPGRGGGMGGRGRLAGNRQLPAARPALKTRKDSQAICLAVLF